MVILLHAHRCGAHKWNRVQMLGRKTLPHTRAISSAHASAAAWGHSGSGISHRVVPAPGLPDHRTTSEIAAVSCTASIPQSHPALGEALGSRSMPNWGQPVSFRGRWCVCGHSGRHRDRRNTGVSDLPVAIAVEEPDDGGTDAILHHFGAGYLGLG